MQNKWISCPFLLQSSRLLSESALNFFSGEKGAEMVDILKKNPVVVVDIVLGRLVQKEQEWEKDKLRMTEVWQRMYDANYHKSLDHRSFYFKQVICIFELLFLTVSKILMSDYWI